MQAPLVQRASFRGLVHESLSGEKPLFKKASHASSFGSKGFVFKAPSAIKAFHLRNSLSKPPPALKPLYPSPLAQSLPPKKPLPKPSWSKGPVSKPPYPKKASHLRIPLSKSPCPKSLPQRQTGQKRPVCLWTFPLPSPLCLPPFQASKGLMAAGQAALCTRKLSGKEVLCPGDFLAKKLSC